MISPENLVPGRKYYSTAFDKPVKLLQVERIEDGVGVLNVLYKGRVFYDFSFSLEEILPLESARA